MLFANLKMQLLNFFISKFSYMMFNINWKITLTIVATVQNQESPLFNCSLSYTTNSTIVIDNAEYYLLTLNIMIGTKHFFCTCSSKV